MIAAAIWVLALTAAGEADPCGVPASDRAPDPRCGETLDGRVPVEPSTAHRIGRTMLLGPRLATRVALWPVVKTADVVESNRVLDWTRAILTTDDGLVGVRPEFQYSTSFYPTGGLHAFYGRLPGQGSQILVRGRTAGPSILLGQISARGSDALGLSLLVTYDRRNDRLFAGIGPRTDGELAAAGQGQARYASDNLGAALRWSRPLPWHLTVQAHGDLQRRDFRAAGVRGGASVSERFGAPADECVAQGQSPPCVDEGQMPGFARGTRLAYAGIGLGFNGRRPTRDGSGVSVDVEATIAQGIAGDPSQHASWSARAVGAVGANDRLFLLRARAAAVQRLSAAAIPFDELVVPSGLDDMRGFPTGRFRGESALTGTAEYRWYISSYLDAALFADIGTVAGPRFSGLDLSRWFPTFGLGLRFYNVQSAYWKAQAGNGIQVAYAPDGGFRVLFALTSF
jgi:hypothetical protein